MARAAMGSLEPQCWTIIFVCTGAVAALVFFLVLGASVSGDDDPGLPIKKPFSCSGAWTGCTASTFPAGTACTSLITELGTAMTTATKTAMMQTPCENYHCVPAMLGVYWKARCGAVFTGATYKTCAAAAGTNSTARFLCEKQAAVQETSCAHLGLAGLHSVSFLPDTDTAWYTNVVLNGVSPNYASAAAKCTATAANPGLRSVPEAMRCGSHPQLAWETLSYVKGGSANAVGELGDNRCSAVTFASMVQSPNFGRGGKYCNDPSAHNYNANPLSWDVADSATCIFNVQCSTSVLTTLYGNILNAPTPTIPAAVNAGSIVQGACNAGFSVSTSSNAHYCSLSPFVESDVPQYRNVTSGQVFGTWTGGFTCNPRPCPTRSGSGLAPHVCSDSTCGAGKFECAGKVNGDICSQVDCERGYTVNSTNGVHEVFTCGYNAASLQMEFTIPTGCVPDTCLRDQSLAGKGYPLATALKTGVQVNPSCSNPAHIAAGAFECMSTKLIQGGSCTTNACSDATSPQITTTPGLLVGHGTATVLTTLASSDSTMARKAWDNDPMTYWMSMNLNVATTGLTPSNTDWLELEIPASRIGVRPCGYSIQLGRSTVCPGGLCSNPNWEVSLVKPTEWVLKAGASKANTATHITLDRKDSSTSPYAVTGWKPPCNQRRDQIDCGPSQFPIGQSGVNQPVTPFRYFKITFTADNTASLLASSLARGQVIVQDIHLKEAYAKIPGTGHQAAKLANGDLASCLGGTVQSAATSLKACVTAVAALGSGPLRQGFKFDFTTQTCTSGITTTLTTPASPNTVCYI